jgi:hypothetical protein
MPSASFQSEPNLDFNIHNMDMKRHLLICLSYPCKWVDRGKE